MKGLEVHTGNRLESLARTLAEILRSSPPASPFSPIPIVVPGPGMQKWLSLQLATHMGVAANLQFPFPNHFLWTLLRTGNPELPDEDPYAPQNLLWKIMKQLPRHLSLPEFKELSGYVKEPNRELKLLQISEKIAGLFDQYLLYRPEMMKNWNSANIGHWQARLWRSVSKEEKYPPKTLLGEEFMRKAYGAGFPETDLWERIFVFGFASLPPFHLSLFRALARLTRVHLFSMNPCREFWFDLRPNRFLDGLAHTPETADVLHYDKGNPLLSSWGEHAAHFLGTVLDSAEETSEDFQPPEETGILHGIQSDLFHLRSSPSPSPLRTRPPDPDISLQIHECPSRMREVEVLHHRLLDLLERDTTLSPSDMLFLVPDLESYAPFIRAVFDTPPTEQMRIPYQISGRMTSRHTPIIRAFFEVLDFPGGRFSATEVAGLLDYAAVRDRFSLSSREIPQIRKWVIDSGIRWGKDSQHRKELGFPGTSSNTWEFGVHRLLLGVCFPEEVESFSGRWTCADTGGRSSETLGRFLDYVQTLHTVCRDLLSPRKPDEWARALYNLLDHLFLPTPDREEELGHLYALISELRVIQLRNGYDRLLPIESVRYLLRRKSESIPARFGLMSGGVTFADPVGMRGLPFRVIGFLGMRDGHFPRKQYPLAFDQIASAPLPGDRFFPREDKYTFLEALASARDVFYLSYATGTDEGRTSVSPSHLLDELIDYLKLLPAGPGDPCSGDFVIRHPLHSHSRRYFRNDPRLFSYSLSDCRAGQAGPSSHPAKPFCEPSLPAPAPSETVELESILRFFRNPCEYFLKEILHLRFSDRFLSPLSEEPLHPKGLDRYEIIREIFEKRLAGESHELIFKRLSGQGKLPIESLSHAGYWPLASEAEALVDFLSPFLPLRSMEIRCKVGDHHLVGKCPTGSRKGIVRARPGKTKGNDLLQAWILHLAASSGIRKWEGETWVVGTEPTRNVFTPLAANEAESLLENLMEIYLHGHSRPLPLFPGSSLAYAQALPEKGEEAAHARAAAAWKGSPPFALGEVENPYVRQCFADVGPALSPPFADLAGRVFLPLLSCRSRRKHAAA